MEIAQFLYNHSIKPSYQRVRILKYLLEQKNHPTVDMIYKELVSDLPTLSKTTVYNTLKNFVQKGITQIVTIEENETRFDADISTHGHFKCRKCKNIFDFQVNVNNLDIDLANDFVIEQNHIYITGICKKCNN